MTHHNVFFAMAVLVCMAATIAPARAQQQVTPPAPILVSSPIVTINNSAGDQTNPHVDKDVVTYTDFADNPDLDFRYDASLMGYVINLSTKGYATGTYKLNFIASADPNIHSAGFAVK